MSSVSLTNPTNEAFADIKEEIEAEAAANPTKKKLGVLFWVCVAWIVLVAAGGHLRQPPPAAQPEPGELQQRAERRARLGPSPRHRRPLPGHLQPARSTGRGSRSSSGFGGALIGLVVGGIPAMISAYRRGRIDTALNTGSYIVLAFPAIVAVIAIVSFWGKSLFKITLIIGLFARAADLPGGAGLDALLRHP